MIREATDISLELAEELRPALLRVARGLRRETEQLGVTSRQVTLLWLIRERPGGTVGMLAAEEGISPPSLSGHLDRLERLGLVERTRSTTDRRKVELQLTKAGRALLRRVRHRRTTWLADRLDALEPTELRAIEEALPALRRLAEPGAS